MSRFTHWMFHFKRLCVNFNSLNLLLFVMNNRKGPTYICKDHQQCFDISRGLGDRVDSVNNGERPEISTARFFLPHDQIMTFDWMWTVTLLLSMKLFMGVEIINCVTWYAEVLHYVLMCIHLCRRDTAIMLSVSKSNKLND